MPVSTNTSDDGLGGNRRDWGKAGSAQAVRAAPLGFPPAARQAPVESAAAPDVCSCRRLSTKEHLPLVAP